MQKKKIMTILIKKRQTRYMVHPNETSGLILPTYFASAMCMKVDSECFISYL